MEFTMGCRLGHWTSTGCYWSRYEERNGIYNIHMHVHFHSVSVSMSISIHIDTRTYVVYDGLHIGALHLYGMPLEQVN